MRQENRLPFYVIWHLFWGLFIAYAIAFLILHSYSLAYPELGFWGMVWRTISYVIPQWHMVILPAGLIVALLSFSVHGFIRGWQSDRSGWSMGAYTVLMLLGTGFFLFVFRIASLLILIPLLIECLILGAIDGAWDRQFAEKPKRKSHDEEED